MAFSFASNHGAAIRLAARRDGAIATTAAACLVGACVLTPASVESGPVICPFRLLTGLPCPGCGLTRSWVALAHGSMSDAVQFHLFGPVVFVAAVVTVIAVISRAVRRRPALDVASLLMHPASIVVIAGWLGWWAGRLVA